MAPTLYRIILQVDNLDRAEEFYGMLLVIVDVEFPRFLQASSIL